MTVVPIVINVLCVQPIMQVDVVNSGLSNATIAKPTDGKGSLVEPLGELDRGFSFCGSRAVIWLTSAGG